MKPNTRKEAAILVPALLEEKKQIQANAQKAGLPTATFLRQVGLGYEVRSRADLEAIRSIIQISKDHGRVGGLLKMWLTNDEKLMGIEPNIKHVLSQIETTNSEIRALVASLAAKL